MGEASAQAIWLDVPVRVSAVHVQGLQATSDSLIEPLLGPILEHQGTISETLVKTQRVCQTLERLGVFSSVSISLDASDESAAPDNSNAKPIQVTIGVVEKPRFKASAQTGVRGSEGFMV